MIEYQISIPEFMWHEKNWKQYVTSYLNKNRPEMKPIRVHRPYWIVCVKRSESDGTDVSKENKV